MSKEARFYQVEIVLATPMLGTVPYDPKVFSTFLAESDRKELAKKIKTGNNAADGTEMTATTVTEMLEDEVKHVATREERGWTGFFQDAIHGPFIQNHMILGFLRNAAKVLQRGHDVKQLRSKVDSYVFVKPRKIFPVMPENGYESLRGEPFVSFLSDGKPILERPLRAETAQGPRVTVVRSDLLPAGTRFTFTLKVLPSEVSKSIIEELLEYGQDKGLGQWRNGNYGSFDVVAIKEVDSWPKE